MMGIFGAIRDAIFGTANAAPSPPPATGGGLAGAASATQSGGWGAVTGASPAAPAQPVDVEAVLAAKSTAKGNPDLNYRTSIVDLMKLLYLDSSLASRGQLADELGYTGEKNGSAEMNIWLHRKVMEGLESNGGVVPESMKS